MKNNVPQKSVPQKVNKRIGVIERYFDILPVSSKTPVITLSEGSTPLIKADNLKKILGVNFNLYLKYEGLNPTGSFKDRGMTVAVSKAAELGAKAVICASTGNTSASASAYAVRAGIKSIVVIPEGAIALGKLSQALIHGAEVVAVKGNFDRCLEIVIEICENYDVELVNSINPNRIEGQKTAAYEIAEALGDTPGYQFMPVGNAGNITAYWKGYKELNEKRNLKLPVMMGFQAAGSAPIVEGKIVKDPRTIATAIKIGNPASWKQAESARDESDGVIDKVTDEEILSAWQNLADREGVFVEPASAASFAGLKKYLKEGNFDPDFRGNVVCILTGHGLKDPDRAIDTVSRPPVVEDSVDKVVETAGIK
ncbi:MAG: threonine synthase [Elusimicrobia bacterium]|jgi:threonine synthase|nr:threonine synthase [Elusimicrobiota bacterium]